MAVPLPIRWPAAWKEEKYLRLLDGTPFNCLVQESPAPFAPRSGITAIAAGALGAGGVNEIKAGPSSERLVIRDLAFPGMRLATRGSRDDSEAGPTGAPWIDSNSWVARLAQVRAPGRAVWLDFDFPKDNLQPEVQSYQVAIADAAAAGARWIVRLDAALQQGLAAGNGEAEVKWKQIGATAAFFEQHPAWADYLPAGPAGIISSFAGADEFMGQEMLNLSARRNLLYRIFDRARPAASNLQGLRAAVWVDAEATPGEWKPKLEAFARGGGLLVVPRTLAKDFPGTGAMHCPVAGYTLQGFGKGRIASAMRDWYDPYFLAQDVHSLVSRQNDPVRIFNGRSLWQHWGVDGGGGSALLQLVGFGGRSRENVSLSTRRRWGSAKMFVPGWDAPRALQPVEVDGCREYQLPSFSYFAALEFRV